MNTILFFYCEQISNWTFYLYLEYETNVMLFLNKHFHCSGPESQFHRELEGPLRGVLRPRQDQGELEAQEVDLQDKSGLRIAKFMSVNFQTVKSFLNSKLYSSHNGRPLCFSIASSSN